MYSLGVDIGGTKCAVILGKDNFISTEDFIIDKISFPTLVKRGWKSVVNEILSSIDTLAERNNITIPTDVIAIGISCGGPLDSKKGLIQCPPNLPDWDNVPIVKILNNRYKVKVILQNDANACAIAEWKFGAGNMCKNMIFLTFGTGLGAGLILDSKLYTGTNDMAGEAGHIRLTENGPFGYGKYGSFEGYCSGSGISNLAKLMAKTTLYDTSPALTHIEKITAKELSEFAFKGDKFALSVYEKCGEKLGYGLSILIDLLNPEKIVIGSIFARSGKLMINKAEEILKQEALPFALNVCEIIPAKLGDSIGDYAALGLCFE